MNARAFLPLLRGREPRAYEVDPRMFEGRLPSFANTRSMRVAGGLIVVEHNEPAVRERSEYLRDG